jgi:hypothetical protein
MEELKFKIIADSKGADASMKSIARSTDNVAKSASGADSSIKNLAKSLIFANSGASALHKGFKGLAGAGGIGLVGIGAVKGAMAFGDALYDVSAEAQATGKSLDKTFKAGFAGTTADAVQSSIDTIKDEIDKLERKGQKFDPLRLMLKGIEKITGMDLGSSMDEANIEIANKEVAILQVRRQQVKAIEDIVKKNEEANYFLDNSNKKLVLGRKLYEAEEGVAAKLALNSGVINSEEKNNYYYAKDKLDLAQREYDQIIKIAKTKEDELVIKKAERALDQAKLQTMQAELAMIQKQKAEGDKAAQATKTFGGGMLGSSQAGQQALQTAQKQRANQAKQENFKTQEAYYADQAKQENVKRGAKGLPPVTAQDMRVREAEKVAAAQAPTLAEQAQAQATGMSPEQVAISNVAQRQAVASGMATAPADQSGDAWKGEISKTMQSMIDALNALMSAPLVTSGAGGS